ncbi:amidohydrolase family protein [Hyphomonas polymorpha PS728]|uniref:Amidohydrolase family protein n=1 Tax=Hyphomonas polymorpha PS728 TaxID=1280954 RepID=A0A062VDJ4_9PROT|nr:amidohydrolase [Hyphomonas polymorpha]KCZ97497.1 amidohydrolase family protein [Hyphomonas polymorpha PS728]
MPSRAGFRILCSAVAGLFLAACAAPQNMAQQQVSAESAVIFVNAQIITVDDAFPQAEAVAVRDGRILAVGTREEVNRAAGTGASLRDLGGAALAPGFIDTHGHFAMLAQTAGMANVQPPPAGPVRSIPELQAQLEAWALAHPDSPWILGWGYDDSLLAEQRHPAREDLDAVSTEKPVFLMHTSAHLAACNSLCLDAVGISPETPDPEGGIIRRQSDGRTPNGVLEETALYLAYAHLPQPVESQRLAGLSAVQELYASYGITTAQEGAAQGQNIADLQKVAARGDLYLDVVAYQLFQKDGVIPEDFAVSKTYDSRFRISGIKLLLDGSLQGRTGWLTQPYATPGPGQPAEYSGYRIHSDESVANLFEQAYARDIQIIAHANGDRAIDQYLDMMTPVMAAHPGQDQRPVVIHAQAARQDQLEEMAAAGILPSFFAAHPFYWGDWHRDAILGPERAAFISPLAAAKALGIPYTVHNDPPVVPPDVIRLLWVSVNRETRSGQVLGEDQRASPMDALRAVTLNAARQYFEEAEKGSITPGKKADFVILSDNPLTMDPADLQSIRVLETIKEGVTIYTAARQEN